MSLLGAEARTKYNYLVNPNTDHSYPELWVCFHINRTDGSHIGLRSSQLGLVLQPFAPSPNSPSSKMAHQSPMISIPEKTTEEVDWTTPIRNLIAQSYGESPDNYATECASLQRCRQDAVRGAGSDFTGEQSLYTLRDDELYLGYLG